MPNYKIEWSEYETGIEETDQEIYDGDVFATLEDAKDFVISNFNYCLDEYAKAKKRILAIQPKAVIQEVYTVTLQVSGGVVEVIDTPNNIRVDVVLHDYDIEGVPDDDEQLTLDGHGVEYLRLEL